MTHCQLSVWVQGDHQVLWGDSVAPPLPKPMELSCFTRQLGSASPHALTGGL